MLEEYLNSRKQMMLDRINEYSELLEHNKIEKEEAYNKIDELNSLIDEASEIFSSKARIDSEHKNNEVNKIKEKIELIECENNNLKIEMAKASKELVDIQNSINEFKSDYVSRETKYKRVLLVVRAAARSRVCASACVCAALASVVRVILFAYNVHSPPLCPACPPRCSLRSLRRKLF